MAAVGPTVARQEPIEARVAAVLERIRPAVQADGGDVELVGVDEAGRVRVRFRGACIGCPSSNMTLQAGIARTLKAHIPEVTGVEAVE
jgi:Fe-S cluster biogenesis protein NfuA